MGIKRDIVCTICGLAACVCASTAAFVEAAHPHESEARPAIRVDALPVDPDHTHREFDRNVGTAEANFADVGSAPALSDDGANFTLDMLRLVARQNFQEQWRRPPSGLLFSSSNE